MRDLCDVPSLREMIDGGAGTEGQMLFHLALRWAAGGGPDERSTIAAAIAGSGSSDAVGVALVVAGHDLAAHPDDEVLRRAVLVLAETKRRLAAECG